MHTDGLPCACGNCATPLHGAYCHACGQHAHNPLRSFGHAVEDFFESFWHLDGRVFRTLRDLLVPGRVACNYLDGQRARYLPPLRLFVILTVLTFFVGQLAVTSGGDAEGVEAPARAAAPVGTGIDPGAFKDARSEAQVAQVLAEQRAAMQAARARIESVPGARMAMAAADRDLQAQADARIAALRTRVPAASGAATAAPSAATASPAAAVQAPSSAPTAEAQRARQAGSATAQSRGVDGFVTEVAGQRLRDRSRAWHEHDNPVVIDWLPAAGNRWLNHRIANAQLNEERIQRAGVGMLLGLAMAAVPSALFVLVPVFALLLRVMYLGSGRAYLEQLVVALYSHVLMLMTLLAGFVLALIEPFAKGLGPAAAMVDLSQVALWLVVPVYLLLMQRRVYGERWLPTVLKYLLLGLAYLFLVLGVVLYAVFSGFTSAA